MAPTAAIILLIYSFSLTTGYKIMDDNDDIGETLTLVSEFNIKVERIDLISDMKTPMELWYSSDYNRSRIDVYGGMVRRYFYWNEENETNYIVYPRMDSEDKKEVVCLPAYFDFESPGDVFPSEEDFVYEGNTVHEGKPVDVWVFEELTDEEKGTHDVLYSYRTERGLDVPVQLVKKDFNILKGTIDKHVIFNYYNYDPTFCEEELDAKKDAPCEEVVDNFQGHMKVLHPAFDGDLDIAFNSFKNHYKKNYKNVNEHDMRREIFHKNWQFVVDHNRQNLGYKLTMNHFSDLTPAERRRKNGARASPHPSATIPFPHSEEEVRQIVTQLPDEFDLRLEGVISPIKNQGLCGSCWSFATTAAVEGSLARLDGRILDLSEQSIVDCAWGGDNEGCDGGWPSEALRYVIKHGLPLDEDYGGYLGQNGYCHIQNATEVFKIRGFTLVTPLSESAMKVALYKYGPVVVTIQAKDAFDFYSSGVFYDVTCSPDEFVNHAVTIVGYGFRDGVNYWIMKNSYGEQWGEDGYMLISTGNNNCKLLDEPYYAVV